jgi:hypothetical protein
MEVCVWFMMTTLDIIIWLQTHSNQIKTTCCRNLLSRMYSVCFKYYIYIYQFRRNCCCSSHSQVNTCSHSNSLHLMTKWITDFIEEFWKLLNKTITWFNLANNDQEENSKFPIFCESMEVIWVLKYDGSIFESIYLYMLWYLDIIFFYYCVYQITILVEITDGTSRLSLLGNWFGILHCGSTSKYLIILRAWVKTILYSGGSHFIYILTLKIVYIITITFSDEILCVCFVPKMVLNKKCRWNRTKPINWYKTKKNIWIIFLLMFYRWTFRLVALSVMLCMIWYSSP